MIRASLSGFVLAHEFKYLFPREQLKRLILTQALEIFGVPEKKIELLLVELETQKEKMLEIGQQLFEEL